MDKFKDRVDKKLKRMKYISKKFDEIFEEEDSELKKKVKDDLGKWDNIRIKKNLL
ncbi:MAG: hypothetical protein R3Y64_09900 [Peptostreptococcaceae bacterium]